MASKKGSSTSSTSTKKASTPRAKQAQIFTIINKKSGEKTYVKAMTGKEARGFMPSYGVKRSTIEEVYEAARAQVPVHDARAPAEPAIEPAPAE